MEVMTDSKSSTPVLLSNAELMSLLEKDVKDNKKRMQAEAQKQKQRGRKSDRKVKNRFEHRDWIQENVLEYLKGTPCINIPKSQLSDLKLKCMSGGTLSSPNKKKRRTLSSSESSPPKASPPPGYGLTEAEAVQILNFMPQEPVEIHLMIDELHDRMSEAKQEEFLNMIRSYNTSVETPDNEGEAAGTEEVVKDSIEMLEKAGNQALNGDGDADMKIKEEI